MSKGRRGKQARLGPFVGLEWVMLNSEAYKKLPASAAKALPYFWGKPGAALQITAANSRYYEHVFDFTYGEAKRYGFASGTFSLVIRNLVAYGFIDPVEKGGLKSGGLSKSLFKCSRRWQDYGLPRFKPVRWEGVEPNLGKGQRQKPRLTTPKPVLFPAPEEPTSSDIEAVGVR